MSINNDKAWNFLPGLLVIIIFSLWNREDNYWRILSILLQTEQQS